MRALPWVMGAALAVSASAQGLSTTLGYISAERFPEIEASLTVFSEQGRPVSGLTRDAFTVTEDGAKVALKSVDVSKQPITIALALDTSAANAPALEAMKESARDFVRGLEDGDTVAVVAFSDQAKVVQERTGNRDKVFSAIGKLRPEGASAMFDAIDAGLDEIRPMDRRRIVLVFAGGRDRNASGSGLQSTHSAKSVAKASREMHIPIWTIGFGGNVDRELLGKLAKATGGASYFPKDAGTIRAAFTRALTDVRLSYTLTYTTPKPAKDGSERAVAVASVSQGKTGQGSGTYRAPAPEPPKPSPRADGEVDESVGGVSSVVKVQLAKIKFRNFNTSRIWVWPDGMALEDAKVTKKATHLWVTGNDMITVAPGRYRLAIEHYSNTQDIAVVDLKSGTEAVIKSP